MKVKQLKLDMTEGQYLSVESLWNWKKADELSWDCSVCLKKKTGDGYLIAQVGGPAAADGLKGKLLVVKMCPDCGKAIDDAIRARTPRPEFVYLPQDVRGDYHRANTVARAGIHKAIYNPHGAVSVVADNGYELGIKPDEFEDAGPHMHKTTENP